KESLLFLVLALGLLCSLIPQKGHPGDTKGWASWTTWLQVKGLTQAYSTEDAEKRTPIDYAPVWVYCLSGFGKFIATRVDSGVFHWIYALKAVPLFFDILVVGLALFVTSRN